MTANQPIKTLGYVRGGNATRFFGVEGRPGEPSHFASCRVQLSTRAKSNM